MLRSLLSSLKKEQERLRKSLSKEVPLFVKIAPDLDAPDLETIAKIIAEFDIDGVIATNTTIDKSLVQNLENGQEQGGLSGAPLSIQSTTIVRDLRQLLGPNRSLIGVGGVMSAEDGLAKLQAGADLIQVYSGLIYKGPGLVHDLVSGLDDFQRA